MGHAGEFSGQTVLITGGGGGVGRAMAMGFAAEGAAIVVADIDPKASQVVVEELRGEGRRGLAVGGDVSDAADCGRWVRDAMNAFGALDVLINNAGVGGPVGPVHDMDLDGWSRTLTINLTGAMLCSHAALAAMLPRRRGSIVNVASNVAKRGLALRAPYVVSKWGMLGLTQTLALELAQEGIRVNAICPGPVEGARVEGYIRRQAEALGVSDDEVRRQWLDEIPMRRMVTADEVAQVALFLASPRSSGLTGQAVNVAAGLVMH